MLSPFIQRLLFARQIDMSNGEIILLGEHQILLPSEIFFSLEMEGMRYDALRSIARDYLKHLSKKFGSGREGMLKRAGDIFETFGLGKMKIENVNAKKKAALIVIPHSPIALEYLEHKKMKKPACLLTSAILAGFFSFMLNKTLHAKEVKCLAKGDEFCEFKIQ